MLAMFDCPACGSTDRIPVCSLRNVPVNTAAIHSDATTARAAPQADLEIECCRDCGLLRNTAFDQRLIDYAQGYEAALEHSPVFREYASELVARLSSDHQLAGKTVVDIGAGTGDFLIRLGATGPLRGIGYDASYHGGNDDALDEGLEMVRAYLTPETAPTTLSFFSCRHVLEHIAQPRAWLEELSAILAKYPSVTGYFEVPNADHMLDQARIWDLVYQHPNYFSSRTLRSLLERTGFAVTRTALEYGDQFLGIDVASRDTSGRAPALDRAERAQLEDRIGRFGSDVGALLHMWERRIDAWAAQGLHVVLWGASSKSITFLNVVPGASDTISMVVDINPRKRGSFTPVTGHPIVAPADLATGRPPDVVMISNPLYTNEISDTLTRHHLAPRLVQL